MSPRCAATEGPHLCVRGVWGQTWACPKKTGTWGSNGKIPWKSSINIHLKEKKHLLLGELCVVVFDWTYPKACENSCEWIPGDTGATSTCPWKMGLQPAYAILAKLRQSKCPCPQNSRWMTMEPSASKDDSMSLLWDTRHKVYKVYLEVQLGLWKVITMVTTSTSWDVTPTTHGDVVIWPTVEHGLWSNISQVIGYMLILKINENPSPYLKWCMKNGMIQPTYEKKIQVEARFPPQTVASKYVSLVESNVACSWRYWGADDHHDDDDEEEEEDHKDQDQDQEEENYGICRCLFHTLILTSQPSLVARLWPLPVRSEVGRHGLEI